jgi:hypothetical protein
MGQVNWRTKSYTALSTLKKETLIRSIANEATHARIHIPLDQLLSLQALRTDLLQVRAGPTNDMVGLRYGLLLAVCTARSQEVSYILQEAERKQLLSEPRGGRFEKSRLRIEGLLNPNIPLLRLR